MSERAGSGFEKLTIYWTFDGILLWVVNADPTDAGQGAAGITRLIGEGQGTRQIAQRLRLSIKTIESHREHIKQKLTLKSGKELTHRAIHWVETGRTS